MMRKSFTFLKAVAIAVLIAGCGETGKESDPEVTPEINIPEDIFTSGISVESASQSVTLNFTANVTWSATVSADWVTISPSSGVAGNNSLKVNIEENKTGQPRSAILTIADKGSPLKVSVAVRQEALVTSLGVNPESLTFTADKGEEMLTITSNTDWTATSDAAWLKLSKASGSGNAQVTVTAEENTAITERTATISLKTSDSKATATVKVTQGAANVIFTVDKDEHGVAAAGESFTVKVTGNIGYKISSQPDWVKQTDKASSGNTDTYTFRAEANSSTSAREGAIVFCNDNNECVPVTVRQAGADAALSVSPAELTLTAKPESKTVAVTSNTDWTATSDAAWLKLSKASGSGNAQVTVTAETNNMGIARTATITIKTTNGKTVAIKVTQGAADLILKINNYSFYVESEGGTIKLKVTHNVDYTISKPDWISLATKTTNGDTDTLTFNVLRNSGFKRKENIIFDTYRSRTFVSVTQHGSKKSGSNDDTTTGGEITVE